MHQHLHVTVNQALILLAFLTLLIAYSTYRVARHQLEFMKKQDKTNKLLLDLSSRTSLGLSLGKAGSIAIKNVGQLDVYLHGISIDTVDTIRFDPPGYLPPGGSDFYKEVELDSSNALTPGSHSIHIYVKDSLKRKWILEGTVIKDQNSQTFTGTNTIMLKKKAWKNDL